jgi:hypothetical protein
MVRMLVHSECGFVPGRFRSLIGSTRPVSLDNVSLFIVIYGIGCLRGRAGH